MKSVLSPCGAGVALTTATQTVMKAMRIWINFEFMFG
jgi:hypothetical protein